MLFFFPTLSCSPTSSNNPQENSSTIQSTQNPSVQDLDLNITISSSEIIPKAKGYYAADLNGDGIDENIYYDNTGIRANGELYAPTGAVQLAHRADRNRDGKEELIIALGAGKGFRDAAMQIISIDESGVHPLWSQKLGSNQIADIHIIDEQIFFVHSTAEGAFAGSWLIDGSIQTIVEAKLALRMLPKNKTDVYVGRVYGDQPRSNGDLRLFSSGTPSSALKNFRGVRALAYADVNQDGTKELMVSDGWHYQYGTMARARVSLFDTEGGTPIPICDLPEEYTINKIEQHKDKHDVFLLQASRGAYVVHASVFGWKSTKICRFSEGDNTVFRYEDNVTHVLCSGSKAQQHTLSFHKK